MKLSFRFLFFLSFCLSAFASVAQAPKLINYQAALRNADGTTLNNTTVGIRFTIRETTESGNAVYVEEQTVSTNELGMLVTQIGNVSPLDVVDWANGIYFLQVEFDPNGGTNYSQLVDENPRLVAVPYALHARTVEFDADSQKINLIGDSLFITNGGHVILQNFTDTDEQTLSIDSTSTNDIITIQNGNSITIKDDIQDADSDTTNELQVLSMNGDTVFISNGNFIVLPNSSNDTDWNKTGNYVTNTTDSIGIGTTNPKKLLHVEISGSSLPNLNNTDILFQDNFSSTQNFGLSLIAGNSGEARLGFGDQGSAESGLIRYVNLGDRMEFHTGGTSKMLIQNNGNVAIGSPSAVDKMEIHYSSSSTSQLRLHQTNTDFARLAFSNTGTTDQFKISARPDATKANANFNVFYTGVGNILQVWGSGNVGIGTITPPDEKLHILNGTIKIDDGVNPYNLPFSDGTNGQVMMTNGSGVASWGFLPPNNDWGLIGNSGTNNGTNFIGTTDAQSLDIRTNNIIRTRITTKGQIEVLNTGESVFLGQGAGAADDLSTNRNVFVGYHAGHSNSTGSNNNAIGASALYNNTIGNSNNATGYFSLYSNTTGSNNTAFGNHTLNDNITGNDNAVFGYYAGYSNTGSFNTYIGDQAGANATSGTFNAFLGRDAGLQNTTGGSNTFIGGQAGNTNTTGNNNTIIGKDADVTVANLTNATAIGYNAQVSTSNSLVLGNGANVGIGITAPTEQLEVALTTKTGGLMLKPKNESGTGNLTSVTVENHGLLILDGTNPKVLQSLSGGQDGQVIYILCKGAPMSIEIQASVSGQRFFHQSSFYTMNPNDMVTAVFFAGNWHINGF